jgi:hypothetical protein
MIMGIIILLGPVIMYNMILSDMISPMITMILYLTTVILNVKIMWIKTDRNVHDSIAKSARNDARDASDLAKSASRDAYKAGNDVLALVRAGNVINDTIVC